MARINRVLLVVCVTARLPQPAGGAEMKTPAAIEITMSAPKKRGVTPQ